MANNPAVNSPVDPAKQKRYPITVSEHLLGALGKGRIGSAVLQCKSVGFLHQKIYIYIYISDPQGWLYIRLELTFYVCVRPYDR